MILKFLVKKNFNSYWILSLTSLTPFFVMNMWINFALKKEREINNCFKSCIWWAQQCCIGERERERKVTKANTCYRIIIIILNSKRAKKSGILEKNTPFFKLKHISNCQYKRRGKSFLLHNGRMYFKTEGFTPSKWHTI